MNATITYLEMTGSDELRPAVAVPHVELESLEPASPLIRTTTERIARPYSWPSLSWTDREWAEFVGNPLRWFWLVRHAGEIAGLADFETQGGGDVEITTLGLVRSLSARGSADTR